MKYLISERQYNLLSEQPDSRMPFQPETFGYNPKKPETTKAALQKQKELLIKIVNEGHIIPELNLLTLNKRNF